MAGEMPSSYAFRPSDRINQQGIWATYFGVWEDKTVPCVRRTLDVFAALFISRGSGWFESSGLARREKVESGSLIWLFPGVMHTYAPDSSGWSEHWVTFDGPGAKRHLRQGLISPATGPQHFDDPGPLRMVFAQLRQACDQPYDLDGLLASSLVSLLVLASHQRSLETAQKARPRQGDADLEQRMTGLIGSGARMSRAAAASGLSESTFRRRVQTVTGDTPKRFAVRERLRSARELLLSTDLPVSDIAVRVGVEDPFYFSRFFRRHEGLSPTAFRQLFGGIQT